MKKFWIVLFLASVLSATILSLPLFGERIFRGSASYTGTNTGFVSFTNQGISPLTLSALECRFDPACGYTVLVYRVRGIRTNRLREFTSTAITTNIFAARDEFDGLWFQKDDVLRIYSLVDSTNFVIPNLEAITLY